MGSARARAKSGLPRVGARSGIAGGLSLLAVAALALSACATPVKYAAKPVRFVPPGAAEPWVVTGRLDRTDFDMVGDETVTVWINNELAAVGGFQVRDGIADGSFTGAYRGAKITVHCTNRAPPEKGLLCDLGDGEIPAGTLAFVPEK